MRLLVSIAGVAISIGFMLAAGIMNWRYGQNVGRSDEEQLLSAAVAAGIDAMKVLLPFFLWWAVESRRLVVAGLGSLLLAGLVGHSVVGVAGYLDLSRATVSGTHTSKKNLVGDLEVQRARKDKELASLGVVEPLEVIETRLQGLRQDRRFMQTAQCNEPITKEQRTFCSDLAGVQTERSKATSAKSLSDELLELRNKLNELTRVGEIDKGDARAGVVARVTGWDLLNVQTWLALLQVVIIETMSTFGIFLSLNHGGLGQATTTHEEVTSTSETTSGDNTDVLAQFVVACLRPVARHTMPITSIYPSYVAWSEKQGLDVLSETWFATLFQSMCRHVGIGLVVGDTETSCIGLDFASEDSDSVAG